MSRPDWHDLPRVESIARPVRLSQSVLKHANLCPRSAYLYLRYGSVPSVELDRGTAFHLFAQRAMETLIAEDEPRMEPDVAKDLAELILDEHPELGVTAEDALHLREQAYHWAVGFDPRPREVVTIERLFVLDVEGWEVRGKADLVRLGADLVLDVPDYKTQLWVPPAAEFEGTFQLKLYIASVMFGQPVTRTPCPNHYDEGQIVIGPGVVAPIELVCTECGGTGYTETREPCIGDRIHWARGSEVYPRFLNSDGTIVTRTAVYSRDEIREFLGDLARVVRKVGAALEDWKWPAIRGTHCSICPCRSECPLPERLRSHSGEINSLEEASEAAEWADAQADLVRSTREEIKRFAKHRQVTVPVGLDEEYVFEVRESFKTDWDALEVGVERARQFGEPFSLLDVRKRQTSASFVKRKREVTADA